MYKNLTYPAKILVVIVTLCLLGKEGARAQQAPKPKTKQALSDSLAPKPAFTEPDINISYTTTPRKNLTGSVSVVPDARINEQARVSPVGLLQGQAAGIKVVNSSGAAGASGLITIRGISTFNGGTTPLFILDGVPIKGDRFSNPLARNSDNDPISDINPADIASITILKGAQAVARYGMRGANGVVLIDTYGGTNGKTLLDFSTFTGIQAAPKPYSVLDAAGYRAFTIEKEQARGFTQQQINNGIGRYLLLSTPANQVQRYNNNTDWQDMALRRGLYTDYHLNLRGGDAVSKYSLMTGYTNQTGVVEKSNYNRFSTRFNLDYKVGRKLSFINSVAYTRTSRNLNDEGNAIASNPLLLSAIKSPTLTVYQQNLQGVDQRDLDSADYAGRNNPYAVIDRMRNENNTNRIFGKITGQYVFSPGLTLRVGLSADYYRLSEKRFRPSAGFMPEGYIIRASYEKNSSELMALNENVLSYNKTSASGAHVFSAFVGSALQLNDQNSKTAVAVNSTSDQFSNISTTDQRFIDSIGSFAPNWRLLSFFGGIQYAFQNKYLLGANLRADGSSRFAEGHRWGYFPSVSAGWRIGQEAFLKDNRVISELKLRSSYGLSGNQEVGFFNSLNALIPADYSDYAGVRIGILGNPNFTWERTKQFDAGLDLGLMNDRLLITTDVYVRNTTNLYNTVRLPGTSGFRTYAVSEGSVRNTGVELAVTGKVLTGKFGWQTGFNATLNRNKILSTPALFNPVNNYGDFTGILQTGNAIGAFYGYKALGVYRNTTDVTLKNGADNANPFRGGDIIFEDVDKNGIIDQADRQVIGNANPDVYGGFNNTFAYRNFDLNVFVDFSLGNEVYNAQRAYAEAMSTYDNQSTAVLSRWRAEGDVSSMPRALHGDAVGNTRFSSRWIEDGSFARIKALTLGYNFPLQHGLKRVFKSARILFTAQNLVTFTKYKGFGPEAGSISNPIVYGIDYAGLPQLKSFILGLKLGL